VNRFGSESSADGAGAWRRVGTRRACLILTAVAVLAPPVAVSLNSAASAAAASKSPILIGESSPQNSPAASLPTIEASIQAGVRAINASGGIKGHPVKLVYCNNMFNPNQAVQCARTFVSDHVVATVGDFDIFTSSTIPLLSKAHIPQLGATAVEQNQYTSPDSYLIEGGPNAIDAMNMLLMKKRGFTKVAIPYFALSSAEEQSAAQDAEALGLKVVATPPMGLTQADYDPTVAAVTASGAQAADVIGSEVQVQGFVQSYQSQGAQFALYGSLESTQPKDLQNLKGSDGTMSHIVLSSTSPPLSATKQFPAVGLYVKQLAAEYKSGDNNAAPSLYQPEGIDAWAALNALVSILRAGNNSTWTGATVTAALNNAKDVKTGIFPPWTPSASSQGAAALGFPRISDPFVYVVKVVNGVAVLAQKAPIDAFDFTKK
jgi:ABC-type branched-subunit amino acid transport system substrate-binding protein